MRQNIFDGKEWYPPPLSILTFFDTRNVLKNRRVPLRNFSVLWDKNFDMKSWYSLPPSPPLLSIKVFDTRNFVKHRRSPLRSFSVLWDNSFSIENRDIPLLSIKFFDTRIFSPTKFFGTLRQQIFYRKSWYSPYRHKIFRYVKLSETQGFLYEMIRYWDKNFWNTEGFLYEMIRYWDKTSETQKGSSMKWFGTETKKFWTENRDAPPPTLRLLPSIFRYPKLMKH